MAQHITARDAEAQLGSSPPERLINEHEAARVLGLSVKTLRRWRWSGKPPSFYKIGAAVRYDLGTLRDFIAAGGRKSTSDPGDQPAPAAAT